jgi:BirA family biotin operon repressor/biotin-[acetyl-CoA-carboxylase] ligase
VGSLDQAVKLLQMLDVGSSRSGEEIAATLGCSRAAVWKQVEVLRGLGVPVAAAAGQGYRLDEPFELLDVSAIGEALPARQRQALEELEVYPSVGSTNAEIRARPTARQHGVALLAERQTSGRGRHGRHWFSPFGRNIYLSLGWRFESGVAELSPLPLLVALAAAQALAEAGLEGHVIKWPNDLLVNGRKLGGCLVEVQGDAAGPCTAVLGLGVNVRMPGDTGGAEKIDQPWTDLASQLSHVSRNGLAAALLSALLDHLSRFERRGFGPFLADWSARDWLAGHRIDVSHPGGRVQGTARGVSIRGGLIVETTTDVRELHAGEVTLRRSG